jgi:hypothetical protein
MPPKDEWWLLPLSHLEYHKVNGDAQGLVLTLFIYEFYPSH